LREVVNNAGGCRVTAIILPKTSPRGETAPVS
jgi:hypothetical protein